MSVYHEQTLYHSQRLSSLHFAQHSLQQQIEIFAQCVSRFPNQRCHQSSDKSRCKLARLQMPRASLKNQFVYNIDYVSIIWWNKSTEADLTVESGLSNYLRVQ